MSETKKLKLSCGWCDYDTLSPEEMATHMISTGHALSPGAKEDMVEGALFAGLVDTLRKVQADPEAGRRVTQEEWEELPEDVRGEAEGRKFMGRKGDKQ